MFFSLLYLWGQETISLLNRIWFLRKRVIRGILFHLAVHQKLVILDTEERTCNTGDQTINE